MLQINPGLSKFIFKLDKSVWLEKGLKEVLNLAI